MLVASKDGASALIFTRKYLYASFEHLGFEAMLSWSQVAALVAAGIAVAVVICIVLVSMGYKPLPTITGKLKLRSSLNLNWLTSPFSKNYRTQSTL